MFCSKTIRSYVRQTMLAVGSTNSGPGSSKYTRQQQHRVPEKEWPSETAAVLGEIQRHQLGNTVTCIYMLVLRLGHVYSATTYLSVLHIMMDLLLFLFSLSTIIGLVMALCGLFGPIPAHLGFCCLMRSTRWMYILGRTQGNMLSLKKPAKCVRCVHRLEGICLLVYIFTSVSLWGDFLLNSKITNIIWYKIYT
jgi:hypothetical protein